LLTGKNLEAGFQLVDVLSWRAAEDDSRDDGLDDD
jgi:hypothetical protein